MPLKEYRKKRNFSRSAEPKGRKSPRRVHEPIFVIQEHHARRLHFDFRIEWRGILVSWAVTKEPSADPKVKRLAIQTEDHPLDYARFEGEIPEGEYGAGSVEIWDHGTYEISHPVGDSMERGTLELILHGHRLKGRFILHRMSGEGPKSSWIFFKGREKVVGLRIPI